MFLTIPEAAKHLKCSAASVKALIDCNKLESIQVGNGTKRRTLRIPLSSLESLAGVQPPPPLRVEQPQPEQIHPALARRLSRK